jgi:hypothetical protein
MPVGRAAILLSLAEILARFDELVRFCCFSAHSGIGQQFAYRSLLAHIVPRR